MKGSGMNQLTDAEIKAANLKQAEFLKRRIHDKQAVASYVKFLDGAKS